MAIDTSIYGGASQGLMGSLSQGFDFGSKVQEKRQARQDRESQMKEKTALEDAFKANTVVAEDGSRSLNKAGVVGALAQAGYGQKARELESQFQKEDAAAEKQQYEGQLRSFDMIDRTLSGVKDEESYQRAVDQYAQMGGDISQLPPNYDPQFVNMARSRTMDARQRLEAQLQGRQADRQDDVLKLNKDRFGFEKKKFGKEYSIKQKELALKQREQAAKLGDGMGGDIVENFKSRVSGLGAEERKRLDNIRMGKSALDDMSRALGKGDNTFSLVGDNDFTFAENQWNEAIGRMQSGGAINKEEAANFKKLVPKPWDSKEMQVTKIKKMQDELGRRLQSFGFRPEEVPDYVAPDAQESLSTYAQGGQMSVPGVNSANAAQGSSIKILSSEEMSQMPEQDLKAILDNLRRETGG